jgi:hypothetical protein
MDKCLWIGAGYPVLVAGIVALWKVYLKKDKDVKKGQEDLLREKEWHVRELEEFKKMVERRARHDSD